MNNSWFKIDNSAILYTAGLTYTTQNLFKISTDVSKNITKNELLEALKKTLELFPTFKTTMRKGFFRCFFETNNLEPVVEIDNGALLLKLDFNKNNRYMFKITYFNNRITGTFYHGLCDGSGAISFMRNLVFNYLLECGYNLENDGTIKTLNDINFEKEAEDSFLKHIKPYKLNGGVYGRFAGRRALQIVGSPLNIAGYSSIEGRADIESLKAVSKKHGVSITALVAANVLLAIARVQKNKQNHPLTVAIPVDLRQRFCSNSMLNFTTIVKCEIGANEEKSLENYAKIVSEQLKDGIKQEYLQEKISASNLLGTNKVLKALPLFVKLTVLKLGKVLSGKTKQTIIVSNLGIVNLTKEAAPHIKSMAFNLNVSKKMPINFAMISHGNIATMSFTSRIKETDIQDKFYEELKKENVQIDTISNLSK